MKIPIHLGPNINASADGKTLTITIDLSTTLGESKSGKSILIASTNGNQKLPSGEVIGLNVYRAKA